MDDRLTWTQEERKREGIGYATFFNGEICAKFDKRLSEYEDTGLLPAEIVAMREELEKARKQIADNAVFMAVHGAGGYVFQTHADDVLHDHIGEVTNMVALDHSGDTNKMIAPVAGIPTTANHVLSLAEVLALPEGARVWVEERGGYLQSEVHVRVGDLLVGASGMWYDPTKPDWNTFDTPVECRVWHLPVAPTEDELRGNPWGKEGE